MPGRGWVRGLGAIFCLQRSPGCGSGMGINNLAFLGRHAWLKHNVKDLMVILHRLYLMHNFLFKVVHASDMECGFCSNIEYAATAHGAWKIFLYRTRESFRHGSRFQNFHAGRGLESSCLSSKYTHQLWNLWLLVPVSQSDTSLALLVLSKATSSV